MSRDAIAEIRAFNRFYTAQIGALDERFLDQARPLGEARLLFEIGLGGEPVAVLRDRLGLDSGYASRLLRRLEDAGLAVTEADPDDGRRRRVDLTTEGAKEWETLDRLSDEHVDSILGPLGDRGGRELAKLLTRARRIMEAPAVQLDLVDARSESAQDAVASYFAELDERFPDGFEPGDAQISDAAAYDPPTGAFVVARSKIDGVTGCGGLWTVGAGVGEIKRMWVNPQWRGLGIARRILSDLEERSRAMGHRKTILDTNAVLTEAIAMYERAGYVAIERYNDNPHAERWFEKRW